MRLKEYYDEALTLRFRTKNNFVLYLNTDGEFVEEPEIRFIKMYYTEFDLDLNLDSFINAAKEYNKTHQSDPIIRYIISILDIAVTARESIRGGIIL